MQEAWPPQEKFVYYSITKIINNDGKSNNRSRNPKATSSTEYY